MDIDEIEKAIKAFGDGIDDLAEPIPYVKQVMKAYKWAKRKRISIFLQSLNHATGEFPEKDRNKFEKYINSDTGQELLAEYSDTVIRTSSTIANAALGILYSDFTDSIYPANIKRIVCYALQGATDYLLEVFLVLCQIEPTETNGPYPVSFLEQTEFERNTELSQTIGSAEDSFACVNDLIKRSLFLPDHTASRLLPPHWVLYFGNTEISQEISKLLRKAKSLSDSQ